MAEPSGRSGLNSLQCLRVADDSQGAPRPGHSNCFCISGINKYWLQTRKFTVQSAFLPQKPNLVIRIASDETNDYGLERSVCSSSIDSGKCPKKSGTASIPGCFDDRQVLRQHVTDERVFLPLSHGPETHPRCPIQYPGNFLSLTET